MVKSHFFSYIFYWAVKWKVMVSLLGKDISDIPQETALQGAYKFGDRIGSFQ